jgi:hypothetical protein
VDLADLALTRDAGDDARRARDLLDAAQRTVDQYGYDGLQPRIDRLNIDGTNGTVASHPTV